MVWFLFAIGISFATLLYIFANFFFKEIIKDKFLNKFKNLEEKFKKSEFFISLLFIDLLEEFYFQIQKCSYHVYLTLKYTIIFVATFLGNYSFNILYYLLDSGLEKIIDQNLLAPLF